MAKPVQMFKSDGGGLFESEFEALKDDLRSNIYEIVGNEKAAKDIADAIASQLDPIYPPVSFDDDNQPAPQEPVFIGWGALIANLHRTSKAV